jgi:hypothetical protein
MQIVGYAGDQGAHRPYLVGGPAQHRQHQRVIGRDGQGLSSSARGAGGQETARSGHVHGCAATLGATPPDTLALRGADHGCRLKDRRGIATRYDNKAATLMAGVCLDYVITYWLQCIQTLGAAQ